MKSWLVKRMVASSAWRRQYIVIIQDEIMVGKKNGGFISMEKIVHDTNSV